MHAPQIVMIALYALGLGIAIEEHGKPKSGTHNVWITLVATALVAAILWWGGFWG